MCGILRIELQNACADGAGVGVAGITGLIMVD